MIKVEGVQQTFCKRRHPRFNRVGGTLDQGTKPKDSGVQFSHRFTIVRCRSRGQLYCTSQRDESTLLRQCQWILGYLSFIGYLEGYDVLALRATHYT